jgi:hypothetical protein
MAMIFAASARVMVVIGLEILVRIAGQDADVGQHVYASV